MADSPSRSPKPPVPRLDRAALERVLGRAAELQGTAGDAPEEEFTEEQLIELGKEVGLSAQHLRQAMAEERTRSMDPEPETGLAASLFGPSRLSAWRTVEGKAQDVLATIDAWMQRQELMIVKRHHAERIVWEPRQDFLVGIKRALKLGGRDYALSQSYETSATVVQVDDSRVHVSLDADFRTNRRHATNQVIGSTVLGGAATAGLFVIGAVASIAVAPVVVAAVAVAPAVLVPFAGFTGARASHRRVLTRAHLSLEQLLDRLERGEMGRRGPDSLLGAIVAAATAIPPRRY